MNPTRALSFLALAVMNVEAAFLPAGLCAPNEHAAGPPRRVASSDAPPPATLNPAKAVGDMHRIRDALGVFRRRHGGRLPADTTEFVSDLTVHAKEYGIRTADLFNPDAQYASDPTARAYPKAHFPFMILKERPDGSAIGGPKKAGERDILAVCDLYAHLNVQHGKAGDTVHPTGFYIVLWDDGRVEKLPIGKRVDVYRGNGRFGRGYVGQAGIPAGSESFEQKRQRRRKGTQPPEPPTQP